MIKDKKEYKILVIEDNAGDYLLVEEFIEEHIYKPSITHAVNFKQAFAHLQNNEQFDVVLMDLTLPDKSGEELVEEMKQFLPTLPIIILTGYTDVDFSIQSIGKGISDYLLKDELDGSILYKSIIYAIERKKSSSLIADSEKRYSDLFNLSPQPMWLHDADTLKFAQVNEAAINLYGFSTAEFLEMTILDICALSEIEKKEFFEPKDDYTGNNSIIKKSKHFNKKKEILEIEVYQTKITINNKKYISVIAIDVTERNKYEHNITKAIIKTQEEERYEIGGELHDNVCQILATSLMSLGMVKKYVDPAAEEWYNNTKGYINMASNEIRNLSHRLAPAFFDDSNFETAIDVLLTSFNVTGKYEITTNFGEEFSTTEPNVDLQLNLYRIVQEQLRNILKYANATAITLDVDIIDGMLTICMSDNGVGFNVKDVKSGIGMSNMKRRAELFGGKFSIISSPGIGCTINVEVPMISKTGVKV